MARDEVPIPLPDEFFTPPRKPLGFQVASVMLNGEVIPVSPPVVVGPGDEVGIVPATGQVIVRPALNRPAYKLIAWSYRLAMAIRHNPDGTMTFADFDETPRLSFHKPNVPDGAIRDLTPLYKLEDVCPTPSPSPAGNAKP